MMNELYLLMFVVHKKYHLVHNHHPKKDRVECEMKAKKKKKRVLEYFIDFSSFFFFLLLRRLSLARHH
jgi:hypothetical protein